MKKAVSLVTAAATYLLTTTLTFAQPAPAVGDTRIHIATPAFGYPDLGSFINNALKLVFVIAALAVLVMLIWGAVQWIFSGGEKDAVGHARSRIINALIGLAILAVAFALATTFGKFVGINILDLNIPTPPQVPQ